MIEEVNSRMFEDYVYSYLLIEIHRALKLTILVNLIKDKKNASKMIDWVNSNILDED